MRYFTKQWYQTMQNSGADVGLVTDSNAQVFSEAYFKNIYRVQKQKWLKRRKKVCQWLNEPYDETKESYTFAAIYRAEKAKLIRTLPESILSQVADIRLLALKHCTEKVKEQITAFSRDCKEATEQSMSAYFASAKIENTDASLLEMFSFHDETVISARKVGKDWLIDLGECEEGYSKIRYIRFKNAVILKQEKRLAGAWWLYEELYKTETGYEVHVLLDKNGLIEFIVQCDDIQLS
ncbi:MAG: DUF4085 family protein [Oscillospiraceae bacterium]|nr:DUF4085 family protein [Oscillospiraceae bacterium]